jgi:dolichyl-phosphate-mannose--protein O-mannosyl transferase
MALSQHEQKILSQLEYSLFAEDPRFGESLSGKRIYDRSRRIVRWGVMSFVTGSLCLVLFFTSSFALSLLGLATMFISSIAVLSSASALNRVRRIPSSHPSVRIG